MVVLDGPFRHRYAEAGKYEEVGPLYGRFHGVRERLQVLIGLPWQQ